MFDNLVSIHDIPLLIEKIRQGRLGDLFSILSGSTVSKGIRSWDHLECPPKNWWDIPAVMQRWNVMVSGDPNIDYFTYFYRKFLAARAPMSSLSLGCGTGQREVALARLGGFRRIDGVDISAARVLHARQLAADQGFGSLINYIAGDVFEVEPEAGSYDVVLAEQSLHHFSPLERILRRAESFLRPDGFFIFNEYVGPSRFQWTDRQLEEVNALLSVLPRRYRVRWRSGTVKRNVHRPGRLGMMIYDPTEAVESSRILPLIGEIFDVIETRGYGGTVIQLLFADIAHNFLSSDSETQKLLRFCFDREDELLSSGELHSDFVVGICRRRSSFVRSV